MDLTLDLANIQRTAPPAKPAPANQHKVDAAAKDFESVFISQMLEIVWETVPTDGPMGGGTGENIFRSMMIQDIGRQMSQQGGIGLAANVKSELLAMQEASKP